MPDKIKPGFGLEPAENVEGNAPMPTRTEQNVLAILHEKTDGRQPGSPKPDEETLSVLHGDIEGCESYPLLQKYVSGELPTLKKMFDALKPFLSEFYKEIENERIRVSQGSSDAILKTIERIYGLLSGREQQVRAAIQRYVNSVVRFRHLEKLSAGGGRDLTEQFVKADHARRRAHDSLIESFKVHGAQVRALLNEGFGDESLPFVQWNSSDDARKFGVGKCVYFSEEVLRNRDFIRDWAIVADFAEQLELLGDDEYLKSMRDRSQR